MIKQLNITEPYKTWQADSTERYTRAHLPTDHIVQLYDKDDELIVAITTFVVDGLNLQESTIIIATKEHLELLRNALLSQGLDLAALQSAGHYIPIDAEYALSLFMIDEWPNEAAFEETISGIIQKAGYPRRRLRAFGEMVAILWANQQNAATIHLEHLWNKFCEKNPFQLLCAYPKSGFKDQLNNSFQHVCKSHSKAIGDLNV